MKLTDAQMLMIAQEFESFTSKVIRIERAFVWGGYVMLPVNVACVVWRLPVENWNHVFMVLANIAAAVITWDVIARGRANLADMIEARDTARRHIHELTKEA